MSSPNKGRAYFGLSGYHFDPNVVTEFIGLEPTSVNDAGTRGSLDKPVISSWELSTETITSETQELDIYKLIEDEILKKIEPANETTPDVGFGARIIKFCADIGAFINIDYELSERI